MKKSKGMQLGTLFTVMLLLSMAFVSAVSANQEKDISGDVGILALQYSRA